MKSIPESAYTRRKRREAFLRGWVTDLLIHGEMPAPDPELFVCRYGGVIRKQGPSVQEAIDDFYTQRRKHHGIEDASCWRLRGARQEVRQDGTLWWVTGPTPSFAREV